MIGKGKKSRIAKVSKNTENYLENLKKLNTNRNQRTSQSHFKKTKNSSVDSMDNHNFKNKENVDPKNQKYVSNFGKNNGKKRRLSVLQQGDNYLFINRENDSLHEIKVSQNSSNKEPLRKKQNLEKSPKNDDNQILLNDLFHRESDEKKTFSELNKIKSQNSLFFDREDQKTNKNPSNLSMLNSGNDQIIGINFDSIEGDEKLEIIEKMKIFEPLNKTRSFDCLKSENEEIQIDKKDTFEKIKEINNFFQRNPPSADFKGIVNIPEFIEDFIKNDDQKRLELEEAFKTCNDMLTDFPKNLELLCGQKNNQKKDINKAKKVKKKKTKKSKSKTIKSNLQILCFKYYFLKIKRKSSLKNYYLNKLKRFTNMNSRQIYKWLWDEEKRYQAQCESLTVYELLENQQRIFKSFKQFKKDFQKKVKNKGLLQVNKIYLPPHPGVSDDVNLKIWGVKLKELKDRNLFIGKNRG